MEIILEKKALDFQQRLKRRIIIRKLEPRLQRARKLAQRKMAGNDKIKARSQRAAKNLLVRSSSGGKNYSSLSTSAKVAVDRRLESKAGVIKKIAGRLFAKKRKQEMERLARARKHHNEEDNSKVADYNAKREMAIKAQIAQRKLREKSIRKTRSGIDENLHNDIQLIEEIFSGLLDEGKNDPAIFKAVFLAGGPGSGKSFTANKVAFHSMGFKTVNVDTFFEHAMKKAGMSLKADSIYSDKGQEIRAKAVTTKETYESNLIRGRLGLIMDGTGKDIAKISKYKSSLEALGYETAMMFVNTDLETAKKRNNTRERTILDAEVGKMWNNVQKNIGEFKHMFGARFFVVDNSEGSDFEKQTLKVFKDVQRWAKVPANNPAARAWKESQK